MEDFVTIFTSLIVVFIILGAMYLAARKMGKKTYGVRQSKYMKVIDRLPVSRDKSIEIVEIGDKAHILGISADNITHLATMGLDELKELEEGKKNDVFRSMFDRLINKGNGGNDL